MLYDSDRIDAALALVVEKHEGNTEDFTTRYAMMMLLNAFCPKGWNPVPQIMTPAGKFPDVAFERLRTSSTATKKFVATVWVEFKSSVNMSAHGAVNQLVQSLAIKQGEVLPENGFLIGVQGPSWLFAEYNILVRKNEQGVINYEVYTLPFLYYDDLLATPVGRPDYEPSIYANLNRETGEGYELDARRDMEKIDTILNWIARSGRSRWMVPVSDNDRPDQYKSVLSHGVTTSTMRSIPNLGGAQGELRAHLQGWQREHPPVAEKKGKEKEVIKEGKKREEIKEGKKKEEIKEGKKKEEIKQSKKEKKEEEKKDKKENKEKERQKKKDNKEKEQQRKKEIKEGKKKE